jgi:hypothetical protein
MTSMEIDVPSNLSELLAEVQSVRASNDGISGANALLQVLRKHHFWPALQVKKFFHESNLVLLHNTYKRMDVAHFQTLYDECRSVVLDMAAPAGENVIVTFAHSIPDRLVDAQYEKVQHAEDHVEVSYEGTVVTVYHYRGKWYFGTSSCPSVDSSRYFHPEKTHGNMFDDALAKIFPDVQEEDAKERSNKLRAALTSKLDAAHAYAFLLVHKDNKHIMDYTEEFGDEYASLVHISTRNRSTLAELDEEARVLQEMGIRYAPVLPSEEALHLLRMETGIYALLVKTHDGKTFKVSRDSVVHQEECDLGNPNKWVNMLWVYMQNRPDYHITHYQNEFATELQLPLDAQGRPLAPTYLIHTVMCSLRDILYEMYCHTTTYFAKVRRFRMNKQLDEQYDPILRFHLAQLRHVQVQHHAHSFLTSKAVYHYLCFHQTLKNVRALIRHFAERPGYFKSRTTECFRTLDAMLRTN